MCITVLRGKTVRCPWSCGRTDEVLSRPDRATQQNHDVATSHTSFSACWVPQNIQLENMLVYTLLRTSCRRAACVRPAFNLSTERCGTRTKRKTSTQQTSVPPKPFQNVTIPCFQELCAGHGLQTRDNAASVTCALLAHVTHKEDCATKSQTYVARLSKLDICLYAKYFANRRRLTKLFRKQWSSKSTASQTKPRSSQHRLGSLPSQEIKIYNGEIYCADG